MRTEADLAALDRLWQQEERPLVVDFWSSWCAPCRALRRQLRGLADERPDGFHLVEVNVEQAPDAAERFAVEAVPTVLLVSRGEIVQRFAGATLASAIEAGLNRLLQLGPVMRA